MDIIGNYSGILFMGYMKFRGNDGDFLIGFNDVDGVVVRSWGI